MEDITTWKTSLCRLKGTCFRMRGILASWLVGSLCARARVTRTGRSETTRPTAAGKRVCPNRPRTASRPTWSCSTTCTGPRSPDHVRRVDPPVPVEKAWQPTGFPDAWIFERGTWLGWVKGTDDKVSWIPHAELRRTEQF